MKPHLQKQGEDLAHGSWFADPCANERSLPQGQRSHLISLIALIQGLNLNTMSTNEKNST